MSAGVSAPTNPRLIGALKPLDLNVITLVYLVIHVARSKGFSRPHTCALLVPDDDDSILSLGLALVTLSPILLMASYAALAVQTREYLVIVMWAGQLVGEGLNYVIKHAVKQDRPIESIGNGYGFPSSHSQYMGYFATFLTCHMFFKHRFASTGFKILDQIWRLVVYAGLLGWAGAVAYSRHHLGYHNWHQIFWGLAIGSFLGFSLYFAVELVPTRYPTSFLGRIRRLALSNPVSTWLQIRDGWAIWPDGGREDEWQRWRAEWEKQQKKEPQRKNQ